MRPVKILNLVYSTRSDIRYRVTNYPDGQQDVTIMDDGDSVGMRVEIVARLTSFKDLELVLCATAALRGLGVKHIALVIPYLLGARSDRRFVAGGTSYLNEVVAPIINSQGYSWVYTLDVHSAGAKCINELLNKNIDELIPTIVQKANEVGIDLSTYTVVCPDAGAVDRVDRVYKKLHASDKVVCTKVRGTDGVIQKKQQYLWTKSV